jgi:hypothetical protein
MRERLAAPDNVSPGWSLVLAAGVAGIDFALAPNTEFPALFFIPILYAAWYGGFRWGLPFCLLPFVHVLNMWLRGAPDIFVPTLTAAFRSVILVPIVIWLSSLASSQRALRREVEMLQGLLPICSYCKRIQDDQGDWQPVERYVQERFEAKFTHSICENCVREQESAWKPAS